MNYSKAKSKIKTAIIILLSFMLLITGYQVWHIYCKYDMSYKPYRLCYIENNYDYTWPGGFVAWSHLISNEFDTVHWVTMSEDFEKRRHGYGEKKRNEKNGALGAVACALPFGCRV